MNNVIKSSFFFIFLILIGCGPKFFNIQTLSNKENSDLLNVYNFNFYISRKDIDKEFIEIAILSTDMSHYGNFFYDDVFMNRLKNQVFELNADAVLYEKNKKDYKDYNEKFIYFTVIRFIEK